MGDLTITKLGESSQRDNFGHDSRNLPVAGVGDEPFHAGYRPDWRVSVGATIAGTVAWLVIFGVTGALSLWPCDAYASPVRCGVLDSLQLIQVLLTMGAGSFWAGALIWERVTTAQARNARLKVTRDALNQPVSADLLHSMDTAQYAAFFSASAQLVRDVAPYRQMPTGLDSLSMAQPLPGKTPAPVIDGEVVDADADVGPVTPDRWLAWLSERAHVLLAAETGGGKSTTAKAILAGEIGRGAQVYVIDPHSSHWFGLPGVGGGEDWEAVGGAMRHVIGEYQARLQARETHLEHTGAELPPDHFARLVVLFDEANNAKAAFDRSHRGKDAALNPWTEFIKVLGSGARKVNICVMVLVQSANVEDLGISGGLRNNFTRIALDDLNIKRMINNEEGDPGRKRALLAKLPSAGRYPATAIMGSKVYLLSRDGFDLIGEPPNARSAAWAPVSTMGIPTERLDDRSLVRSPVDPLLEGLLGADLDERANERAEAECRQFLIDCAAEGMSRDMAFETARARGFRFTSKEHIWAEIKAAAAVVNRNAAAASADDDQWGAR